MRACHSKNGGLLLLMVLAGFATLLFVNLVARSIVEEEEAKDIEKVDAEVGGHIVVEAPGRQDHPQSKVRAFCWVPARIHFVNGLWSDGSELSAKQEEALATWRQHSPEFDIWIWNREKVEELLQREGTFHGFDLLDVFQHLEFRGQMTDLARYAINFFKGGVYADIDVYNYRNIRDMFECPSEGGSGGGGGDHDNLRKGASAARDNGRRPFAPLFYAVTEKPSLQQANYFFAVALQRINSTNVQRQADVLYSTGPGVTTHAVQECRRLPTEQCDVRVLDLDESDSFINHHARGTWRDEFAAWREHRDFNGR